MTIALEDDPLVAESGPARPVGKNGKKRRPPAAGQVRSRPAERRLALLLVLPAIVAVLVALGYPLVRQLIMSVQRFGLEQQFGVAPSFVGLDNYVQILTEQTFWIVLARSVAFCLITAAVTMVIGTSLALLLTAISRPVAISVQIVMLLVWSMPVLSSLQVFQWMFDARSGVIDYLLAGIGFGDMASFNWFAHPETFFLIAGGIVAWMSVPLVVFMVYASVTQLDESMMEAAALDGASGWTTFRHIIAPSIAPVLLLVSLLQVIWDIRVFTQFHVLQANGGITEQTNVLGTYVYQIGLSGGNYGLASAAAMLMLAITLLLTWRYISMLLEDTPS